MKKLDEAELDKLRALAGARVGQYRDGLQTTVSNPVAQTMKSHRHDHHHSNVKLRFGRSPLARRSNG